MRHYRYLQYSAKRDPLKISVHVYDDNGKRVGTVTPDGTFMTHNNTRPFLSRICMSVLVNGHHNGAALALSMRQRREMVQSIRWLRLNP